MWGLILKALPWELVFGLIVKLILYIVDKRASTIEAKEAFLKFIDEIQKDVSVNLSKKYDGQLARLKEKLRQDQIHIENIEKEKQTYKEEYKKLKLIKGEEKNGEGRKH